MTLEVWVHVNGSTTKYTFGPDYGGYLFEDGLLKVWVKPTGPMEYFPLAHIVRIREAAAEAKPKESTHG